ncbi:MAG TPA: hypothetical protein VGU21_04025 [Streptosporangiaceae bacterium]|nr:hypothetical protein [Streptosporangiaceae bacterium]
MSGSTPGPAGGWDLLRRRARVYPPEPPGRAGICAVCRGPAGPGYARCYQCARHERLGPDLLADAVVPISYAVRGTAFADDLWRYKSGREPAGAARASLLALLLAFLHDHGACVWRQAGMAAPGLLAVVPTGCGRPGPHPLLELAAPYLRLRPAPLVIRPGRQGRDPDASRFYAERSWLHADILLLDDSWVSGASAQSAAAALKRAGAGRVAVIVLGRHLDPADRLGAPLAARLAPGPYDPGSCAVHRVFGTSPGAMTLSARGPGRPKLER